jgi:hypothetical protein
LYGVVVHNTSSCYPDSDCSGLEEFLAHDILSGHWRLIKLASDVNTAACRQPLLGYGTVNNLSA